MHTDLPSILLALFVVNLAVSLGAGLYESRIVVPQWLVRAADGSQRWNAAAAAEADVGRRFWGFVTTGPLTLLTLGNLAYAWLSPSPLRQWWLAAALTTLFERLLTFTYFIPTMIRLTRAGVQSDGPTVAAARRWVRLGLVRQAATVIGLTAALEAFALLARAAPR